MPSSTVQTRINNISFLLISSVLIKDLFYFATKSISEKCSGNNCCLPCRTVSLKPLRQWLLFVLSEAYFSLSLSHAHTHACTFTAVDVSHWGVDWGLLGFGSWYFHIKDMPYWWNLTHIILQQHNWYGTANTDTGCRKNSHTHSMQ